MAHYSYNDILNIIVEYHWMVKEVNRLNLQMQSVETVGVASYSDEPKAPYLVSRRIEGEVIRREKKLDRKSRYERRINFITNSYSLIDKEQDKVVLDCMLDGMSITAIAIHLNMNRKTVQRIRDRIIDTMKKGQNVAL